MVSLLPRWPETGGVADGIVPKFSANFLLGDKALAMMIMVCHVRSVRPLDDWRPAGAAIMLIVFRGSI